MSSATSSPGPIPLIGEDCLEDRSDDGGGGLETGAPDAAFTVDAEPELHLVLAEVEAGTARGGYGTGSEGNPHGADRSRRLASLLGHFGERQPGGGGRAGDLVHQHSTRHAAAAPDLDGVAQRHVIGDHHQLDRDALATRELGGEAEIQPVTGVVLDDQQHASRAGDGADGSQHRIRAGRG